MTDCMPTPVLASRPETRKEAVEKDTGPSSIPGQGPGTNMSNGRWVQRQRAEHRGTWPQVQDRHHYNKERPLGFVLLVQGLSMWSDVFAPQGHGTMSGDALVCHSGEGPASGR